MKGMLKAELFKFTHTRSLWIILGVLAAACSLSILTGTYSSAENALRNISKDSMVLILAGAVYGPMILTDDFSSGLLRHFVANGYKRSAIVGAKLFYYLAGCGILTLCYPMFCVSLAGLVQGVETSWGAVLGKTLLACVRALPLYAGVWSLFFLLAFLLKKGVVAMGVSVAVSIILVVFTNKLYGGGVSLLRYSPVIQIGEVGEIAGGYAVSVLVSLAVLAVCAWGSMLRFAHDEL